jgi:ribose/xylose/arabinose/galactoside ABC-type transport system permease subunit
MKFRYDYLPVHLIGEILTKRWIDNLIPFFVLIVIVATFGTIIPDFFTTDSLVNATRQLGEFGIIVIAEMIVMVSGGIDLSVASTFALVNIAALGLTSIAGHCDSLLEMRVFFLQFLQPLYLNGFHAAVFLTPFVVSLFCYPFLPA